MENIILSWQMVQKYSKRVDVKVIDVREEEEYRKQHYKGAKNVPFETVETWILQQDKNKKYIFYCQYGNQSLLTARKVREKGWEAYSISGGINSLILQKME